MKYVFYTLLKANDCETRLKEIINQNIFVREGFIGWVRKGEFRIENRDKYIRNSFNGILYGQLAAIDHGTKIECKLKLPILILLMYKCIDRMLEGLKLDLTLPYYTDKREQNEEKINDVVSIFALCFDKLWW